MSTPSLLNIPYLYKAGTLYSQIPESGAGDFSVTRATTPTAGRSTRINKDGLIELVADNVPRLDYPLGGAVNGCPALLVEPAATNSIRNNSMVGAVAGSPGTLPTNYQLQLAGLTRTIVGTGTENGVAYMDIRFNGTSTGGAVVIQEETSTFITAASGQTWTHSVYLKLIANVLNMPSARVGMYEYTSGGVYLTEGSNPFTLTTSLSRFSFTRTLVNASTARVAPIVQWVVNNGVSYDFTIRIGYPQMELGSVATSVIPTTTQAITRAADVITRTSASALIGQSEGTIYLEIDLTNPNAAGGRTILEIGASPNRVYVAKDSNTQNIFQLATQSGAGYNFVNTTNQTASVLKFAIAYASGNNAFYLNGTQISTASANANPTGISSILLGNSGGTNTPSRIRAAAIYPNRLTNTQLATLTAP